MSGRVREAGEIVYKTVEEALDDQGYVLSIETGLTTVDGTVKKATATYYEIYGVNFESTEDRANPGTYKSNVPVAIMKNGQTRVKVAAAAARTTNIAVGDIVAVLDSGLVAHIVDCPIYTLLGSVNAANLVKLIKAVVGKAEEALGEAVESADGKLLVTLGWPLE